MLYLCFFHTHQKQHAQNNPQNSVLRPIFSILKGGGKQSTITQLSFSVLVIRVYTPMFRITQILSRMVYLLATACLPYPCWSPSRIHRLTFNYLCIHHFFFKFFSLDPIPKDTHFLPSTIISDNLGKPYKIFTMM